MSQIKISQLTPKGAPLSDTDLLAIAEQGIGTHNSKSVTGLEIAQRAQQGMQDELISGTNIKTINGGSVLGSGDIDTTNPTQQYIPVNYANGFADSVFAIQQAPNGYLGWSGLSTKIGNLISAPPGYDQSNIASVLDSYGLYIGRNPFFGGDYVALGDYQNGLGLTFKITDSQIVGSNVVISNGPDTHFYLDPMLQEYYFGNNYGVTPNPTFGIQISGMMQRFGINAGSSPYNPPLEFDASFGLMIFRNPYGSEIIGYVNGDAFFESSGSIVMSSNFGIQMSNSNMFLNGGGTFNISGKALKIIDENGQQFYLPLYTI